MQLIKRDRMEMRLAIVAQSLVRGRSSRPVESKQARRVAGSDRQVTPVL